VNVFRTRTLIREWLVLLAIFAMVLGPLALAVSRSISAESRVQIAAGLKMLPICAPGDAADDLAAKTGGMCDHCLPGMGDGQPIVTVTLAGSSTMVVTLKAIQSPPTAQRILFGLPPATGPPGLMI
jgi:hypothetical protein